MTSILPPNSSRLERAIETALQVLPVPRAVRPLFDPDTCPIELLPWLAWQLGIRSWSNDWPEAVRRERVRRAVEIQRMKGTLGAVRAAVGIFGGNVSIREWWQKTPKGVPHTFDLVLTLNDLTGETPSSEYIDQVLEEVRQAKPLRSHFTFTMGLYAASPVGMAAVARVVTLVRFQATAPPA